MDPSEAQRFLVLSRLHLYYSTYFFLPFFLCVMCCACYVSVYVYVNRCVNICVSVHVEATAWPGSLLSWSSLFLETASLIEPWNHRLTTMTGWHLLESACLNQFHVLALQMAIASVGFLCGFWDSKLRLSHLNFTLTKATYHKRSTFPTGPLSQSCLALLWVFATVPWLLKILSQRYTHRIKSLI